MRFWVSTCLRFNVSVSIDNHNTLYIYKARLINCKVIYVEYKCYSKTYTICYNILLSRNTIFLCLFICKMNVLYLSVIPRLVCGLVCAVIWGFPTSQSPGRADKVSLRWDIQTCVFHQEIRHFCWATRFNSHYSKYLYSFQIIWLIKSQWSVDA